jgi:RNA polymerase sigma factor (sigma-70 family)
MEFVPVFDIQEDILFRYVLQINSHFVFIEVFKCINFLILKNCNPEFLFLSLMVKTQHIGKEVDHPDINRDIIERSKQGNRDAQFQLYKLYSAAMFNICYRMMNKREEAEDMLQESFSEAFHKLDSFRYESTFGAWLKRITVNKCINELKRKKTQLEFFEDMSPFEGKKDEVENYESGLTVENIRKAMEELPKGSRIIFSLYLLEGYDHQEISQILKISESNSKTQYMRAKQKIKELLKDKLYAS